jgi:hypothetical protein
MKKAINPVVELVKAWEVFENENPTGNLEEFCQDYLQKQQLARFKQVDEEYIHHTGGRVVKPSNGLGKALVRVQKYLHFYVKKPCKIYQSIILKILRTCQICISWVLCEKAN